MRHRIKKIPNLSTRELLHSDKSTYFYKKLSHSGLWFQTIPLGLSAFALLLGVMMILPVARKQSEAYAAIEQNYGYDRKISLSIYNNGKEVVDDGTVSTEAKAGEVSYLDNTLKINTSKIANFYVGIQAAAEGGSNLVGAAHGGTIAGVGENVAPGSFGNNTWGYALTDQAATPSTSLTYSTLPAHTDVSPLQYQASNPTDGEHDLKLTFAAKINADRPSDHYQTKVMVSVAADPKVLFDGIYYMQEMTASVCQKAQENDTMQLVDRRDDKSYWVAKLKDGNCWMTQNLDLDIPAAGLKAKDTDIAADWVPDAGGATIATGNLNTGTWPDDNTLVRSYDPGEYVNTNPNGSVGCGEGKNSLEGCPGWVKVTGKVASANPDFGTAVTETTYNDHYAAGNYYNYNAATAGTGLSVATNNADASGSICPKGWQLPYSGRDNFEYNNATDLTKNVPIKRTRSFVNLLEAYGLGLGSDGVMWGLRDQWGNPFASYDIMIHNINSAPLYFLFGGRIQDAGFYNVGIEGRYRSSTVYDSASAYSFNFFSFAVYPADMLPRYLGLSVRCVAR